MGLVFFYSQEMRKYGRYSHLMRKYCNVQKIKFFQKPIDNDKSDATFFKK